MLWNPSHTHSPVMPMAAFVLLCFYSRVNSCDRPYGLTKPKTSTIWPFSEKVRQSELWPKSKGSGVYVFQSMAFCLVCAALINDAVGNSAASLLQHGPMTKSQGCEVGHAGSEKLSLSAQSCVILNRSRNLSESQFPLL